MTAVAGLTQGFVDDMSLFGRVGLLLWREFSARWGARPGRAGGGFIDDDPSASSAGAPARPVSPTPQDPTLARYYANLELPYGAGLDAVREARRRLLKRYHPDLHSADPGRRHTATQVTQGLNHAHDELVSRLGRNEQ